MLFIIQHQTSELWMKLAIHELRATCVALRADDLQPAFKTLARVARIFEQLTGAWDVLRTMTPSEYTQFRDALGQSSGFQSWQYRAIEFLAGNRNLAMLKPHSPHARSADCARSDACAAVALRRGNPAARPPGFRYRAGFRAHGFPRDPRRERPGIVRMARDLQGAAALLGALRTRGKARRLRGLLSTLALQPCDDGRAASSA